MARLSFQDIMNHYPGHNRDVYEDLKKTYLGGKMIPFVGAGLSVFCGYLQWKDLLIKLLGYVGSEKKRSEISDLIQNNEYLVAAGKIQEAYPMLLRALKKLIPYDKIENCTPVKLMNSAAYLLPPLFPESPVVTTNFDRVLEYVNEKQGKKFDTILHPDDVGQLTQTMQYHRHNLFKLHGDIGKDSMTDKKIVFTEQQYEEAYTKQQDIKDALLNWFRNSVMLFLGCSLSKDRTLDLLEEVRRSSRQGAEHFAILPCENSEEAAQKLKTLYNNYGIMPIFYPKDQHDSVQVILERLLEETNQAAYQALMDSRHQERSLSDGGRFEYSAETVSFVGRKKEIEALRDFCNREETHSWWAITAQGGSGKSRLAYEFQKELQAEGWSVKWLSHNANLALAKFEPVANKTLLICDDVQAYIDELDTWMHVHFAQHRSEKLRVLLIERENKKMDSFTWKKLLDDVSLNSLQNLCHNKEQFLELKPLESEDLMALMADFAKGLGKSMEGEKQNELLGVLQKLDKEYQRPLYALAIADAWCNGENPTNWSQAKFLNRLVKRERRYYHEKLKEVIGQDIKENQNDELDLLIAHSCISGVIPRDALSDYPTKRLQKAADGACLDIWELLDKIGLIRSGKLNPATADEDHWVESEDGIEDEVLFFHCPDILREYFVLELALERNKWAELFEHQNWIQSPEHILFLWRSNINHRVYLKKQPSFFKNIFKVKSDAVCDLYLYSGLLFSCTFVSDDIRNDAMARLKKLYEEHATDSDVALFYAMGLVNLTTKQDLEEIEKTLEELRALYTAHSSNEEIAVAYANGLVNLTARQDIEGIKKTLEELRALYETPSSNEEIAVEYAKGLFNLTRKQDLEGIEKTLEELRALYTAHSSNEEIAAAYAASYLLDHEDCGLDELPAWVRNKQSVAEHFASMLLPVSLDCKKVSTARHCVDLAKELLGIYTNSESILLNLAKIQFNVSLHEEGRERAQTISALQSYLRNHPRIQSDFSKALDEYLHDHPEHIERYRCLYV